jgi:hypothetical protein
MLLINYATLPAQKHMHPPKDKPLAGLTYLFYPLLQSSQIAALQLVDYRDRSIWSACPALRQTSATAFPHPPASKQTLSVLLKTSTPTWKSPAPDTGIIIGKFQLRTVRFLGGSSTSTFFDL